MFPTNFLGVEIPNAFRYACETMIKKSISVLFSCCLLLATVPPSKAGRETFQISEQLHDSILEGLNELYNFNFRTANAIFDSLSTDKETHPMVSFGRASSEWWRVSALVLEPDQEESAPFLEAVSECIRVSENVIKQGDTTGEAHLVLGGVLGLLGRWEATNGKWMSAYFKGKKAIRTLEKARQINPELYDADMGIGMFNYFVATLPSVVRVLAFLGRGGDPSVGLKQLHRAAEKGTYAITPSKLFLCQIYSQMEKQPEKALPIIQELRTEYPKSPFIHMVLIISLYNAGQTTALLSEAQNLMHNFQLGVYPSEYVAEAHFALGVAHLKQKMWHDALVHFQNGIKSPFEKDPWITWCQLYSGFCYDALGEKEEARRQYKLVLNLPRRWGSHDLAKTRLKNPFTGSESDLKELSL